MLVFPRQRLVYFAIPKTGTTAFEMTMRQAVEGCVAAPQDVKHMNVRRFERTGAAALGIEGIEGFERFAVLREPIDRLGSWYRYRRRLDPGQANSTARLTFAEFIEATLADDPPPFAQTGDQSVFVTRPDGSLGIDHLFTVENPVAFNSFLRQRFGALPEIGRKNVSAPASTELSAHLRQRLCAARAREIALYTKVSAAGG